MSKIYASSFNIHSNSVFSVRKDVLSKLSSQHARILINQWLYRNKTFALQEVKNICEAKLKNTCEADAKINVLSYAALPRSQESILFCKEP